VESGAEHNCYKLFSDINHGREIVGRKERPEMEFQE